MRAWKAIVAALLTAVLMMLAVKDGRTVWTEASAQSRLTWMVESCGSIDCVTALLNKLSLERALEAKVTTINSQRSFLGALSNPYYVWYRK